MKESEKVQDALPMFHISIPDKKTLASQFMPFAKSGGLYIPTEGDYCLGDSVFFLLRLPGMKKQHAVLGHVFWISSGSKANKGSKGNKCSKGRQAGVGIRFSHQDSPLVNMIKTLLSETNSPNFPSYFNSM